MRIALFGVTGFVGRHLARHAARFGHEVTGIGRHKPDDWPKDMVWLDCDLSDSASVPVPYGTDAVFYLAQSAYYRDFPRHADDLFAVNTMGSARAARAAFEAGSCFFCYASSGSVYAPSFLPLSENSPTFKNSSSKRSPYAVSKLAGEAVTACFEGGMHVCSVRIFGVYGPNQRSMLPWTLLRYVQEGRPIFLEEGPEGADGGLRMSFLYVDDLVARLLHLALRARKGEFVAPVVNLAGPRPVSVQDFANGLACHLGCCAHFEQAPPRQGDLWADTRLQNQLCPMPFVPLEQGLALMIENELQEALP